MQVKFSFVALILLKSVNAVAGGSLGITIPLASPNEFPGEGAPLNSTVLRRHRVRISRKYVCDSSNSSNDCNVNSTYGLTSKRASTDALLGLASLTELRGSLWVGKVTIGVNPLTVFNAQFDSGSTDIVALSHNCVDKKCQGRQKYNEGSEKSRALGQSFEIKYGSQLNSEKLAGMQYTDNIYVAGLLVKDQILGVADTWTGEPSELYDHPDVIFGLGFPSNSRLDPNKASFLEALHRDRKISEMMFAYKVGRLGGTSPQLSIGCANSALYTGDITWVPVVGKQTAHRWIVVLQELGVDKKTLPFKKLNVGVDTGATFMHASFEVASALYSRVPGAMHLPDILGEGVWSVPCKEVPWIWFKFGKTVFYLRPDEFVSKVIGNDGRTYCMGGMVADSFASNQFAILLGNAFLRNVYSIFHYNVGSKHNSYPQLGLAALRDVRTRP